MADISDLNFDADNAPELGEYTVVPKGEYLGCLVSTERVPTVSGNGDRVAFVAELLDGEYRGESIYGSINLWNSNPKARRIAQAELGAICKAVGIRSPRDTTELHNKPMILKVDVEERNDKPGVYRNVIKGYSAANGSPRVPASAVEAAKKSVDDTPPWRK